MSRVANKPIELPKGVEVAINAQAMTVKGPNGTLNHTMHDWVTCEQKENVLTFAGRKKGPEVVALVGTTRAVVNNMVVGVTQGFSVKLELVGVGYRAQAQGAKLNLTLGYSHPVEMQMPEGIKVETPSQTEIVVSGANKQVVGQIAADIRSKRPPEPYKGKGVRYANEQIIRKETKKK